MTWVIENDAFPDGDILLPSLKALNKDIILWDDNFWNTEEYKSFPEDFIFHGSLGNAEGLGKYFNYFPGALYLDMFFSYSKIFETLYEYLLNKDAIFTTIADLLNNPSIIENFQSDTIFARPDSPFKEFSGRLIPTKDLTPAHFDYGFYHENMNLPIVLAPVKPIEKEFRFVCVNQQIITGCEYIAEGRKGGRTITQDDNEPAFLFAQKIVDEDKIQKLAYVIDVCLSNGSLYLVEINPFSGADLYNCDAEKIIDAIEDSVIKHKKLDTFYNNIIIENIWHIDHREENQILSRYHGDYYVYIFFNDGIYRVEVYLDCGSTYMIAHKDFSSLDEAKDYAEKRMTGIPV